MEMGNMWESHRTVTAGKVLLACIGLLVLSSTSIHAFDGKRKGFVVGGGLGSAANSHWEIDNSAGSGDKYCLVWNQTIAYEREEAKRMVNEGCFTGC